MMEDLLNHLENLQNLEKEISLEKLESAITAGGVAYATETLRSALFFSAMDAAYSVIEYINYPPLLNHFLENIKDEIHVRVSSDLKHAEVFDEVYAGTEEDLLEGVRAGGGPGSGTKKENLAAWTYGIYKPAIEGTSLPKDYAGKLPSYEEVIRLRLGAWGEKAPYWRFIEHGNLGTGAYPEFAGHPFIAPLRSKIPDILRKCAERVSEELQKAVMEAIETQINDYDKKTRIEFVDNRKIRVEKRYGARIGYWYMMRINGRFAGRVEIGSILPTGEIFAG